jgi:aspartyl/asparaginyl beta-hydroxylase (cupin superfamily)
MREFIRSVRRKTVKRSGRFLLNTLADFIGRQSLIGDQPVFQRSVFPWIEGLESNWEKIREELNDVLRHRDSLPSFHELSPYQKRISKGDNWKTFVLNVFGWRRFPVCVTPGSRYWPRTIIFLRIGDQPMALCVSTLP